MHWFRWCAARGIDPQHAGSAHVKAWLDDLSAAGAAAATRDRMLGTLKALYGCLAETGRTSGNPAALNRRRLGLGASGRTTSTITLTTAQVRELYRVAGQRRPGVGELAAARARAVVALFTLGLRVSELCGLDRADLHVTRGRRALRVTGKGDKPRVVYLSAPAEEALATYLRLRDTRPAGTDLVRRATPPGPLITTRDGGRCTRQGIWHLLRRIARAADGPLRDIAGDLHPHALRHFYVTTAVEAGAQLVHVQADVGHTSIDTTEQVYNAAARDPSRSAVDLVAQALREPGEPG
ncbi:MAG TPA: tyrosine-type recombinase/integrase [Pseudonocardiaceae bacterium]